MNPEQGIALEWVEVAIQLDVVLIAELPGALAPGGFALVDRLPFQLHLHRHEVAVGIDQGANPGGLDVLELLLLQVQDHVGAGFAALSGFEAEIW